MISVDIFDGGTEEGARLSRFTPHSRVRGVLGIDSRKRRDVKAKMKARYSAQDQRRINEIKARMKEMD